MLAVPAVKHALFAERMLAMAGFRLPHGERETLKALDALGEPPTVVKRRRAREAWMEALGLGDLPLRGSVAQNNTTLEIRGTRVAEDDRDEVAERLAAAGGRFVQDDTGLAVLNLPFSAEVAGKIPASLLPYLTNDARLMYARDAEVEAWVRTVMSTGGIFVLDGGEFGTQGLMESVFGGLPLGELPPLPFPRVWIEARTTTGMCPLWAAEPTLAQPFVSEEGAHGWEKHGPDSMVYGIAIAELEQGVRWGMAVIRDPFWVWGGGRPADTASARYEQIFAADLESKLSPQSWRDIAPGWGEIVPGSPAEGRLERMYVLAMTAWAAVLADVITARGVDKREVFLPRLRRKDAKRNALGGRWSPQIYEVALATATTDEEQGAPASGPRVRFLVRGHWRLMPMHDSWHVHDYQPVGEVPRGATSWEVGCGACGRRAKFVEWKGGACTHVPAFVKGPVGAPWKGRPVYVDREPVPEAVGIDPGSVSAGKGVGDG